MLTMILGATKAAASLPGHIDQCVDTWVKEITNRLEESGKAIAGSGSVITFTNGGYQVSYEQVPEVDNSRVGDPVIMCLVRIPKDCPLGDDRGREYHVTNKRTGKSWTLPDAEHMCGGA